MKVGVHSWVLETRHPLNEAISVASQLGYDAYEVDIGNFGNSGLGLQTLPDRLQEPEKHAILDARDRAGIPICSLCLGALWHYPISSGDERLRNRGVEIVTATIKLAHDLGAECILLPVDNPQEITDDEAWANTVASLRRCLPAASEARIVMGLENVGSGIVRSPHELARMIDEISSPWCKVYYDVGNSAWMGFDPSEGIRFLGDRIVRVHFKNWNHLRTFPESHAISIAEHGVVDFPAVSNALKEVGYDSYVVVEVPTLDLDADEIAKQSLATTRSALMG